MTKTELSIYIDSDKAKLVRLVAEKHGNSVSEELRAWINLRLSGYELLDSNMEIKEDIEI